MAYDDKMQKIVRIIVNEYMNLTYKGDTYCTLEIRNNMRHPEITLWVHSDLKNYCRHYSIPFYHETYTDEEYERDVKQMLKVMGDIDKGKFKWEE